VQCVISSNVAVEWWSSSERTDRRASASLEFTRP
jgi:hypothetical protein